MSLTAVSKTALVPLRARADEHRRPDRLFADRVAVDWLDRVDWPRELDAWYEDGAQNNIALRVDDIDRAVTRLVAVEPVASVVELGCGLSTRAERLDDLPVRWTGVDLPAVVELRRRWGARGVDVAASVTDPAALAALDAGPHVFVAEGLLYYLPRGEVDALLARLRQRWPGSVLVMDVLGANDYPRLRAQTAPLGTPVAWCLESDFSNVLDDFGLTEVPELGADRLAKEALVRYLPRFAPALRAMVWWSLNAGSLPPGRSGNVVGRL